MYMFSSLAVGCELVIFITCLELILTAKVPLAYTLLTMCGWIAVNGYILGFVAIVTVSTSAYGGVTEQTTMETTRSYTRGVEDKTRGCGSPTVLRLLSYLYDQTEYLAITSTRLGNTYVSI